MLKSKEEKAEDLIVFPDPPSLDAVEWPGKPIGKSNTITRTKSRTAIYDKTIDDKPGRKEELFDTVATYLAQEGKTQNFWTHDVIVHGIRVRAITNSKHLAQFWQDNWYSVEEWEKVTGVTPPSKPQIRVFALGHVKGEAEAAYYSRASNFIAFFNTSYYGQLKSWVLGAVGRILANEYGIHSIHGACVEKDKKGILYIAPTGTGKSTSSYGLMDLPGARFHSDDWVYIRYAYTTKSGEKICPFTISTSNGEKIKGFRCFRWIDEHPSANAKVSGFTLTSKPIEISLSDIDFSKGVEAYAFLSEKVFYLRCNLVESFPQATYSILQSHLENVPDVLPAFFEQNKETLENNLKTLRTTKIEFIRKYFEKQSDDTVKETLARLFAFDNARAMLDITKVFEPHQVFVNPLEPVKLSTVMLLKRNFNEDLVLENLPIEKFMKRLLIGETPTGKREIAYNAYRAVDEKAEFDFVNRLEAQAKEQKKPLYELFLAAQNTPETLLEEFELFRVMHNACVCYDLNTILQKDKNIHDRRTAVEITMKVIAKAMETEARNIHYTISNYGEFIQ
jgi:hypothetical protein